MSRNTLDERLEKARNRVHVAEMEFQNATSALQSLEIEKLMTNAQDDLKDAELLFRCVGELHNDIRETMTSMRDLGCGANTAMCGHAPRFAAMVKWIANMEQSLTNVDALMSQLPEKEKEFADERTKMLALADKI